MALEYFDFFYRASFGDEWNQARLAMLSGSKYAALINNYANRDETIKSMSRLGALDFFEFAKIEKRQNQVENVMKDDLKVPDTLKVFSFPNGDTSLFPSPRATEYKLLSKSN